MAAVLGPNTYLRLATVPGASGFTVRGWCKRERQNFPALVGVRVSTEGESWQEWLDGYRSNFAGDNLFVTAGDPDDGGAAGFSVDRVLGEPVWAYYAFVFRASGTLDVYAAAEGDALTLQASLTYKRQEFQWAGPDEIGIWIGGGFADSVGDTGEPGRLCCWRVSASELELEDLEAEMGLTSIDGAWADWRLLADAQDSSGNDRHLSVIGDAISWDSDEPELADPDPGDPGETITADIDVALPALRVAVSNSSGSIGNQRDSAVWFATGHSLLDEPLQSYIQLLATSAGLAQDWNRQHINGSPLNARSWNAGDYQGYRDGANRATGEPAPTSIDLVDHFRNVTAIGGKETALPYTDLIIGEGHTVLGQVQWQAGIRCARNYYDLVREGSPNCVGYYYSSWLGPRAEGGEFDLGFLPTWIAYARENDTAHAAIASRINASLALEGRTDRLMLLPASGALAELVERALGDGVAGITGETDVDTLNVLFSDHVHLTPIGAYFIACVCFGAIYRRDPRGLDFPDTVTEEQAESLQSIAWDVLLETYGTDPLGPQFSASDAKQAIVDFVPAYVTVFNEVQTGENPQDAEALATYFSGTESDMHFDPSTDSEVWLDLPPGTIFGTVGTTLPALTAQMAGYPEGAPLEASAAVALPALTASIAGSSDIEPIPYAPAPVERTAIASRGFVGYPIASFRKDPDAVLDYGLDLSSYLEADETLVSVSWSIHGATHGLEIVSGGHDEAGARLWASGGEVGGDVFVTCRFATSAGRTDDRTIRLQLRHT